jgi:hypothetical protein
MQDVKELWRIKICQKDGEDILWKWVSVNFIYVQDWSNCELLNEFSDALYLSDSYSHTGNDRIVISFAQNSRCFDWTIVQWWFPLHGPIDLSPRLRWSQSCNLQWIHQVLAIIRNNINWHIVRDREISTNVPRSCRSVAAGIHRWHLFWARGTNVMGALPEPHTICSHC